MRLLIFLLCVLSRSVFAQDESPYLINFKVDGPIIVAGVGLSYLGLSQMKDKKGLTQAELATLSKADVNGFDRGAAGNYSSKADDASYIPFYASFAMPVAMLLNRKEQSKAGQVLVLYVETMALTSTFYTLTAGNIYRNRPYVYGTEAPLEKRMDKGARRSFFAGHTAATASATFFAAKVFSDFNPDSRARPYIWAASAIIPAAVGYFRLKAGQHFLSDNLIGYVIGAGTGILVPQLHKRSTKGDLSIVPIIAPGYQSAAVYYNF